MAIVASLVYGVLVLATLVLGIGTLFLGTLAAASPGGQEMIDSLIGLWVMLALLWGLVGLLHFLWKKGGQE